MPNVVVNGHCKLTTYPLNLHKPAHRRQFAASQHSARNVQRMGSRPDVKQSATAVEGAVLPSSAGPGSQRMSQPLLRSSVIVELTVLSGCSPKSFRSRQAKAG